MMNAKCKTCLPTGRMQNVKLLSGFVFAVFLIFNFTFYIGGAFAQVSSCSAGQTACPQGCTLGVNCNSCWSAPTCTIAGQTAAPCGTCQCPAGQVVCGNACQSPAATQGQPCDAGSGAGSGTVNQCGDCVAKSPRYVLRQYTYPGTAEDGHINILGNLKAGEDLYFINNKAIRVDSTGPSMLNIGNYGGGQNISIVIPYGEVLTNKIHVTEKLGVGTFFGVVPAEKLEVTDTIGGVARIRITDKNPSNNPELQLQYGALNNDHWAFYVDKSDNNKLKLWGVGDTGNNRLTIDTAGKVGIGITNPTERLSVAGNIRSSGNIILPTAGATVDGVNLDNVVLTTGSYANPAWLTSLGWSKLTGFPGACSVGQFVTAVGETLTCAAPSGGVGTVSGTGSIDRLAKFTDTSILGDSIISENSGKLTVGGDITATGCFGPIFRQGSGSAGNGNRGGYSKAVCPAGMHICKTDEILNSVSCGATVPNSGSYWVLEGPPGYTAAANDCRGLTSAATGDLGTYWDFGQGDGGVGWMTPCSSTLEFACCS